MGNELVLLIIGFILGGYTGWKLREIYTIKKIDKKKNEQSSIKGI